MISVLLADDQSLVREGFRYILDQDPGITVVGEAADGAQAVTDAVRLRPDVVLMDIRMPILDGLAACRRLLAMSSPPKVVVLTTFDADEYIVEALRIGACGFLLKDIRARQLIDAVYTAAAGDALLSPSVTRRVIAGFIAGQAVRTDAEQRLAPLTSREREVLACVGRGLSNTEIAGELFVSEATIKTHLNRVLAKLHLRDRVGAVILAYETGLVAPSTP
jgi:DNA-binding NarL/FixJ family response regulator